MTSTSGGNPASVDGFLRRAPSAWAKLQFMKTPATARAATEPEAMVTAHQSKTEQEPGDESASTGQRYDRSTLAERLRSEGVDHRR